MVLLIVDDHPTNLKLLRAQLEAEGHGVLEASNGVEALKVLERDRVDAVISDILMPGMDGFRLCLEIRRSAKLSALPFILYTATYSSPDDRELAQAVGADRYVLKPAPARAIFEALDGALRAPRPRPPEGRPPPDESHVLKQYSEALVQKLEEKNLQLEAAHAEILALNVDLEARVKSRTTELQAVNRELEAFSYSVSHDLRAPLRAIGGFSAILRGDHSRELSPAALALLARIEDNVRAMGTLIDALLQLARLGRAALKMQRLKPAHLVNECLEELAPERQGREVKIVMGDLPACRGDAVLLKQVFLNLLSNALKYTRQRDGARIEVGAEDRGSEFVFFVRDNGAGFDMKHADRLFRPFERLHPGSQFEGIGIGLALVRRVAERHGGRIWADAAPERGATFYFSLPAAPVS